MNFKTFELTEDFKQHLISTGGWDKNCPVNIDRLILIEILHLNFDNEIKSGKLLALDVIGESVLKIFETLLRAEFPINSINLLDIYNYNDYKTMAANNTSCFNNRVIEGKTIYSTHAYGIAIDINPLQNPMICYKTSDENAANFAMHPSTAKEYLNRMILKAGMVEPIVEVFFKNGFDVWGGLWCDPIDYHHFQVNQQLAEQLVKTSKEQAKNLWKQHLEKYS